MNLYWFGAFIAWSALMFTGGYKFESYRAGEASADLTVQQQAVIIAAQKNVVDKIQKAEAITSKTEGNYEKNISDIDSLYSIGVQSSSHPASSSLPALSQPAIGACTCKTQSYKLTPKQCDIEEAKLISLWDWVQEQKK